MKTNNWIRWIGVCLLLCCGYSLLWAQTPAKQWRITLLDKETHEAIPQAVISIGKQHFITDMQGCATFSEQGMIADSLRIHCVGYKDVAIAWKEVRRRQPFILYLAPALHQLQGVQIEAKKATVSTNKVHTRFSADAIRAQLGGNLASSLEQVKGVSTIRSGVTLAKPVLHGMYGNRLLIMNNGVRQQGQQWGDDHAPEVDLNNAESVNIVKGAEAVKHGAEALGGVIELVGKTLPYEHTSLTGTFSSKYATNGRKIALTADVGNGFSLWGGQAAWRVQGTYINAGDHSTAHYILNNTGMREGDLSASLGWRNNRWGADVFYSYFNTRIATLYTAQGGDVDLLRERIALGKPVEIGAWSRKIDYPYQTVAHHILRGKAYYAFANRSRLEVQLAYQSDHRDEYHQRRNFRSNVPSLSLSLRAWQLDARWKHHYAEHWSTEAGLFYGNTENVNQAGTGVVPIIPNYVQEHLGAYLLQKYHTERWGAEAGVRADYQGQSSLGIDSYSQWYGGTQREVNATYSLGAHYQLTPQWRATAHVGMAWRAPHVHELYSNGVEHGAGLYMIGDASLRSEQSTKAVVSVRYEGEKLAFHADAYWQWINHYIFDAPTGEFKTVVSGAYPVFRYRSTDAVFRGVDAEGSWRFLKGWTYELGGSMIWANERHTHKYLPYIPSFRLPQHKRLTVSG